MTQFIYVFFFSPVFFFFFFSRVNFMRLGCLCHLGRLIIEALQFMAPFSYCGLRVTCVYAVVMGVGLP